MGGARSLESAARDVRSLDIGTLILPLGLVRSCSSGSLTSKLVKLYAAMLLVAMLPTKVLHALLSAAARGKMLTMNSRMESGPQALRKH